MIELNTERTHESTQSITPYGPGRGIAPWVLLDQIRNTIPFLFQEEGIPGYRLGRHLELLRSLAKRNLQDSYAPGPVEYFELCLATHHATVGSFVPTDVDNAIRFKLWSPTLTGAQVNAMVDRVIESLAWDFSAISNRWVRVGGEWMSGHQGEWFSTSVAAYGVLRRRDPDRAAEMAGLILKEIRRQAQAYSRARDARDGLLMLKCATIIAHNLGDLDRVVDAWNLEVTDPLRNAAYKLGHGETRKELNDITGLLAEVGKMNKACMAADNHRNLALRKPRCLRRNRDLLLPISPFLDEWGSKLARHPDLKPEEIGEVTEALVEGWERLEGSTAYARALAGLLENFPGGLNELSLYVPARIARALKSGPIRQQVSIPRSRFEEQWNRAALKFL